VGLDFFAVRVDCQLTPHPRQQLGKTSDEDRHANNYIWDGYTSRLNVNHRQDEGRRGEREESTVMRFRKVKNINQQKNTYRGPGLAKTLIGLGAMIS